VGVIRRKRVIRARRLWRWLKSTVDSWYGPFERNSDLREAYLVVTLFVSVLADVAYTLEFPKVISFPLYLIAVIGLCGLAGYGFRNWGKEK
jgi:hypothetical protein